MKKWAYLMVAMGAALWGIIGFFVQKLYEFGFTPLEVVAIRVIVAASILIVYVAMTNRTLLKIKPMDGKYFIGTGIISIVFFNWCFFTAIQETSLSIAAILLYTGPAFVTILSRILFKEWLTTRKVLALITTLIGCAFVIGVLPTVRDPISFYGFIVGMGSGVFYALYSVFGKFALDKYHTLTIITYTFVFASVAMILTSGIWNSWRLFLHGEVWLYSIGLGFIPTVLAYMLYTTGLFYVESSRASITATIEPVVAVLMGILLFGEILQPWQVLGVVMVIGAVIMVQEV